LIAAPSAVKDGHFRSSERSGNCHPDDRFQAAAADDDRASEWRILQSRRSPFLALMYICCWLYVRSSIEVVLALST